MASLVSPSPTPCPLEEIDVSRAELWREDRFAALLARLRAEEPVHFCPASEFGPYWSVTRHADIMQAEALAHIFSSSYTLGGITILGEGEPLWGDDLLPMFIAMDRPEHTGQRRTVAPAFTPSEMGRLGPSLRARTEALVDTLPVGEEFDWVDRVSIELTTQMLAILFDFPWEDRRLLTYWSDWAGDIESARDPELGPKRMKILWECAAYFTRLWQERQAHEPRPDLISRMIHSEATKSMTPQEYLGNLILLIVGGNDTTRNSMSALPIVNRLWPEEYAKIAADRSLVENGVQELIRWQTPLAHMRRTALEDHELGGKAIAKGDKVVLWYMSGNRDEEVFPEGDRYIADRANARRHLAFGFGIHRCVGARLAELQLATLFDVLLDRGLMPVQTGEPERVNACFVHGYRKLPAKLVRSPA
ncbi:cytochrome P450 [Sphingosinicella terrae]|uniref:cytochrome P450 n=1 Tax=Sphingosinicella terrae TaxID=2172047 RepID=UPI0025472F55|nr:cytochrome P450 [Sphingosinicella terrae]